jgi:ADP-ribosyl-[dinitrogen reductase] hydrolase
MNSILGALVGDAAGAVLEGLGPTQITEEKVADALTMPGGGRMRVGPGQITDDGELTLTLYSALSDNNEEYKIAIAKAYAEWYNSFPFDIGFTCSKAFEILSNYFEKGESTEIEERTFKDECMRAIGQQNHGSEANGALMRITGMLPWALGQPLEKVLDLAKFDTQLSHPNPHCIETSKIYIYALFLLYRSGLSHQEIIKEVDVFVDSNAVLSQAVKQWYFKDSIDITDYSCKENIGHVKHAFVLAMYFLRHPEISFQEAIRLTLLKGGDTDTNAAIVGGLVAAYQPIPEELSRPVIEFSALKISRGKGHLRPDIYRPATYSNSLKK